MLEFGKNDIYNLGITLGLLQPNVKNMRDTDTFRDDVIASWLQKQDNVTKRGEPTWNTLARALRDRRVNKAEVANQIESDIEKSGIE